MSEIDLYQPNRGAVAEIDTDSWTIVAGDVFELADRIAHTEFVPRGLRGKPPAVVAAILYGREVGLPPMSALTMTHVIEGTPAISAEAMRALVFAAGHEIVVRESSSARCRLAGRRRGSDEWTTVTWTVDDARKAGLLKLKSSWEKYPRQMLKARATSELCRDVFPDVIHGFRAVEELTDDPSVAADLAEEPATNTVQRKPRKRTAKATAEPKPEPKVMTDAASVAMGNDGRKPKAEPPPVVAGPPPNTEDTHLPETIDLPPEDLHDTEPEDDVVDAEVVEEPEPPPMGAAKPDTTRAAMRAMLARFTELGLTDRGERLYVTSVLVGRELASSNDMTRDEISGVIDTLGYCETREDLDRVVATTEEYAQRKARASTEDEPLSRDQLAFEGMDDDADPDT